MGTGTVRWTAIAGLGAALAGMRRLHGHQHACVNVRAAYLGVLTDAASSVGVIVAALVMRPTGWYWLDPLLSAGIGLSILPRTVAILKQSGHVLLEGTPRGVDLARLRAELLALPGVEALHDLHFWTLTSGLHSASVHVCAAAGSHPAEVLHAVQEVLRQSTGVDHATVQVEHGEQVACRAAGNHA